MAIYKPTDCSPFNGTFDISKNSADLPIIFECKVDTSNTIVTGYSIEIYDSNNSLIFPPTSREQGPIKNNVTYLSDLRPYVTTNFQSLLPNLKNINSGLNGSYLEIPFYVEAIDTTENSTVSRNQMSANSIPGLVEGQTYTWKITLYQGIKNDNDFPPANEKVYDMTVASGTVIGSNEKRIQTALIDSDDKVVDNLVLLDKFIQPIQISELGGYDPTNQKTNPVTDWTGDVPTTFAMTRSLITGYDSTYGYIYPSTAEGNAFADGQIVPENANGFQIFKNGNNPSNLGATDMVEFIYDSGEFNGKMTWKTSAAKSEQSYWEQVYLVDSDPGGIFYPLKGDGYSSFALTGSERIIFNNIQDPKVQYAGIYYGSPYNGIFEPHFSSKEISTNNKASSGTYMLPAGTYTFKQDTSVEGFTGEQNLNFFTTKNNGVVSEWVKIRTTTDGILYTPRSSSSGSLVYLVGGKFIDNTETITLKTDQEVSADFLMWFSQNVDVSFYQVTVVWNRTSDASNWGTLSNKIIYCRRDGKNYEINTTTQVGEINKTPFKFVEEKPVRIFNTAEETINTFGGKDIEDIGNNSRIFYTKNNTISSILSVTNNNGVDITKDCVFEVGKNYIIYTSSSAIPSDLTISVKYIPFNIQDYTGIIFYNKQATTNSDTGIIYIRPSININKNMIFKEVTTIANPTWFNINYFNKDYNYITYTGNQGFSPEIDKTRYQIKSFYKDSDYNPFSIYKNPEIVSTISGNVIESDGSVNIIVTRNFTVTSTYNQDSYIQWKSYQWILYDSAKRTILEKTDEQYDGEITATFYGLDPQKYYILSLVLQTNTGKIVEIDYVIYSDFTEVAEQRDLIEAEFDCDTLSMKVRSRLINTILAPNADEYLSGDETPKENTAYYYDKESGFYQKNNGDGAYETVATINNGTLKINGQNSIDYSKSFESYAINSNMRTGTIQTNANEIIIEGEFMFSEDYNGDIFSIARDDNSNAIVSISIPKVLEEVGNDGFVNLSNDANKLKIKNGSYLKVIDENGILSNTWQDSEKYHNTSVWKKSIVAPTGDRINVANFKYAEVKDNNGTYNKDTYLNIAGPYNSYDEAEPLKDPMNPKEQKFSFMSSDGKDISGMCSDGSFYINQPDRLIWLDYKPCETQMEVVQDTDENGIPVVDKQSVCVETPLKWDDNTIWKDGIYVTKGLEKTLIGQISVNGTVVESDYLEKTSDVQYSNSGLTKQNRFSQRIVERKSISNYSFSFRVFINTSNYSVDLLRSRCYIKELPQLNTPQNISITGSELSWDEVPSAEEYRIFATNNTGEVFVLGDVQA